MRTAAGRRALQLALLVSGLFALGLLYGEQAQAADGVPSATLSEVVRHTQAAPAPGTPRPNGTPGQGSSEAAEPNLTKPALPELDLLDLVAPESIAPHPTAPEATAPQGDKADQRLPQPNPTSPPATPPSPSSRPDADNVLRPVTDQVLRPVTDQILRPVTEDVVGSVGEQVVRPVGDLVTGVTQGLADGLAEVQGKIPPLSLLPESPALPELPGLLPGLPELPVLPALPGQTLPAPVTATPQPGADAGGKATDERAAEERTDKAAVVAYGPAFVADVTPAGDVTHVAGHRVQPTEYAPERQEPAGDPGGSLGNRSAADAGTSRHGDAHAVQLNHRAPLRLVAGAAARTDAAETRDSHPDIPVSPA
ncbi:hypothetical protein AB0L99_22715 [Streptomyces sp. NPDC051954]